MILEVLENKGVSNMEKYHSLMGELDGINFIKQELQSLLDKQEHIDDWGYTKNGGNNRLTPALCK